MTIAEQVHHLVDLGVAELAGLTEAELRAHGRGLPEDPDALVVVHPALVPPSRLAGLLTHRGKPGFVVADMTDLDEFAPLSGLTIPDTPLYLAHDVDRGDELRNWSPDEALPALTARGRTPLTVNEGVSWLLHEPQLLEPNHCFMTIGSRLCRDSRLDARTPAIWISGGTGRDGAARRHAPKVGWCWAGNRHTWLGFASASHRS